MKRPLIKLYISLAVSLVLAIVLLPGIVGKTSAFAAFTSAKADLMSYNAAFVPKPLDEDKAHAVIIMDDGWETQYTKGYEILSKYDMVGCVAVVPSLVGTPDYMDFGQISKMYMSGWDMLNHTYSHDCLTRLTMQEQAEQMNLARDWLTEHKLIHGKDILVYPNGAFTDETIEVLEQNGFSGARSLRSVWDAQAGGQREDIEIFNIISDTIIKQVHDAIDKAIASGNTCIFMLHKIEPVTLDDQMQISEELFVQVVKYLHERSDDIDVVTMTQLMGS